MNTRLVSHKSVGLRILKRMLIVSIILLMARVSHSLPPAYHMTNNGLRIDGVTPQSPMIYDNDWWTDVPDAAFIWTLASEKKCDLRGNIVSMDMWGCPDHYQFTMQECMKDCRKLLKAARTSGLHNIPDPVEGASIALNKPASGKIEDTQYQPTPGSAFIVKEAMRASPHKPLLIFCGGPCTTVATAYLTHPAIAERMIVFQVDGGAYNGKDHWAWEIVKQRCHFANWAKGYFWGDVSKWNPDVFQSLPSNPLGIFLRAYASGIGKSNQWGDGSWIYYTFDHRCISKVEDYDGVAITVPKDGVNVKAIEDLYLSVMK
jgi:hypothetical protein